MSDIIEFAKALKLLNHEYLLTLNSLKNELNIKYDSEIGMSTSGCKDDYRLYLVYYFTCPNSSIEYKFVICVNKEDQKGNLFHLGFSRKDNKKLDFSDEQNCRAIIGVINRSLPVGYEISKNGRTIYLSPLSKDKLKNFLNNAFSSCSLGKLPNFKDDSSKDFITLTKAEKIIREFVKMK